MPKQNKTYSPFKVRLQTRRLTNGSARRETRRPETHTVSTPFILARAA
jgi:hypothetical protein